MHTLKDYMVTAHNYLGASVAAEEIEREKILAFCKEHSLDEKFLSLVKQNDTWREIADRKGVKYYVDVPKHRPIISTIAPPENDIDLRIFAEDEPVAVIKIVAERDFLLLGRI